MSVDFQEKKCIVMGKRKELSVEERSEIISLRRTGMTMREIARKVGCSAVYLNLYSVIVNVIVYKLVPDQDALT